MSHDPSPPDGKDMGRPGPQLGIGRVERLLVLRTFGPFADLPTEELNVIAEHCHEQFWPRGAHICIEGTPVRSIQFIVRGEVQLYRNGRPLRRLDERSAFGGIGVFAREVQGYDGFAEQDTTTLEIPAEDMLDIFEDHFALLRATLHEIAGQILSARRRLGGHAGFEQELKSSPAHCPDRALDLVERMAFLRRTLSFAQEQLESIADLARESTEIRLTTGETLWERGARADHIVIPICGALRCTAETGQSFHLGPGDVLGGLDALAEEPRWCDVVATDPVVALKIDSETLFDLFEDNFEMALEFLQMLSRTLLALVEREAAAATEETSVAAPDVQAASAIEDPTGADGDGMVTGANR